MKMTLFKKSLCASVLLSSVLFSTLSFATAQDVNVTDIQADHSGIKTDLDTLITNQSDAWGKQFSLGQFYYLMPAPGTTWAMAAGNAIGTNPTTNVALQYAHQNLMNSLGLYSGNAQISFGNNVMLSKPSLPPSDITDWFTSMLPFFTPPGALTAAAGGNTVTNDVFAAVTADILQNTNLDSGPIKITPDQAQKWIALLTKPVPGSEPTFATIQGKVASGTAGYDEKAAMGNLIIEYAVMGVSTNALSDMIARRTSTGGAPTVMDVMDNYSTTRFTNKDWYNNISTASDTALLREIAHMMAYQTWMSYQNFRLLEQQTALASAVNSIVAQLNTQMRQLQAQIATAQAQAISAQQNSTVQPTGQAPAGGTGTTTTTTNTGGGTTTTNTTPTKPTACNGDTSVAGCSQCSATVVEGSAGCSPQ